MYFHMLYSRERKLMALAVLGLAFCLTGGVMVLGFFPDYLTRIDISDMVFAMMLGMIVVVVSVIAALESARHSPQRHRRHPPAAHSRSWGA